VAANSATLVADLDRQVDSLFRGTAAFNNETHSIGFHIAGPDTPRVNMEFHDCQGKGWVPTGVYDGRAQWRQVPIPADAEVAPGSDRNLTVWSPSTDQLWEFWLAERTSSGWRACWGGRIDNASTSPGYFPDGFGSSATGLSLAGGMVGLDEIRAGRIDHVMSLNIFAAASWQQFAWPAQRSDGHDPDGRNPIVEGTRFRLDPSIDVTKLGLHPVAEMIAAGAQEYGFVVQDTGGAVAVIAQSGVQERKRTGVDPWGQLLGGTANHDVMAGFPWDRLQALPAGYGRP
jgi:hypothetical protein